jgi:hypothetical protein
MRALAVIFGLISLPLLTGCSEERQPGPPIPLKSFILHDVQGYHGGNALWAAEDRTAFVQVVEPPLAGQTGLWEKRYKTKLTQEHWAEVEKLIGAHHFLTLKIPERPGIPDEAHPIIALITKGGDTVKVRKLANDKHAEFDSVYDYLLGICRTKGELVREGAFDWDWKPEGFERPW